MSKTSEFFNDFYVKVRQTPNWAVMTNTVENSQWHREANVAVHTDMVIKQYVDRFYKLRTPRQQMMALIALLFHDFGKPEAEEEKPREDGSVYRTYAGHEPISANEFMSFMCDNHELRQSFFDQGFDWHDIRRIKVMIEHHLPYSLEKPVKRIALRSHLHHTLGEDYVCFYDMLISDCYGRISDDHETKKANVHKWIEEFDKVPHVQIDPVARRKNGLKKLKGFAVNDLPQPTLYVLYGVSGAGKSTWLKENFDPYSGNLVYSEDELRMQFAIENLDEIDLSEWPRMTAQQQYDAAWKYCAMGPKSAEFDKLCKATYVKMLERGNDVYVDRMNQGRRGRGPVIEGAKQKGYKIVSIEFYISESESNRRQKTRGEKFLAPHRVRQVYLQQETPWLAHEVDAYQIVV